jgi:hypothetical protein
VEGALECFFSREENMLTAVRKRTELKLKR